MDRLRNSVGHTAEGVLCGRPMERFWTQIVSWALRVCSREASVSFNISLQVVGNEAGFDYTKLNVGYGLETFKVFTTCTNLINFGIFFYNFTLLFVRTTALFLYNLFEIILLFQ